MELQVQILIWLAQRIGLYNYRMTAGRSGILERQDISGESSVLSYFHRHIAQQEEHQSSKLKVAGSTPVMPIMKSENI